MKCHDALPLETFPHHDMHGTFFVIFCLFFFFPFSSSSEKPAPRCFAKGERATDPKKSFSKFRNRPMHGKKKEELVLHNGRKRSFSFLSSRKYAKNSTLNRRILREHRAPTQSRRAIICSFESGLKESISSPRAASAGRA